MKTRIGLETRQVILRLVLLAAAALNAVGCSYIQMQPKGGDRPPAPNVPKLP